MEGLSRIVGAGPTIEIDGQKLSVNAKILRHYGEMEAEIVRRRGNPFDAIRDIAQSFKDAPDAMRMVVQTAFDQARSWRTVTYEEMSTWMFENWGGWCFSVWLSLRDNDPTVWTLQKVGDALSDEFERITRAQGGEAAAKWKLDIDRSIQHADGEDEMGNSTGSPPSGTTETGTKTETKESSGT